MASTTAPMFRDALADALSRTCFTGDYRERAEEIIDILRPETDGDLGGWAVVDAHGGLVYNGMFRQANAQIEADELNRNGNPDGRPYSVTREYP